MGHAASRVIARENNVLRVDFGRGPNHPGQDFPAPTDRGSLGKKERGR